MSATPSPVISMDATENPYAVVLNKRVRAYKKKVERISALKGKQNLEKEQQELCAHADLYNSILSELLLIKSQFDEIDATKVNNCKEDVEEVSVEQESNENIPSSLPVETNEPIDEPVIEQVTESVSEQVVEEVIESVQEEEKPQEEVTEEKPQEEKPQEEVTEETPVENQEAPKEECSETAAVEEKQPEEGKKEKKPRKFYHGRNGDHKGNNNHGHYNRNNRHGNYHRNNKKVAMKDEDGWETPKKVVYIKKENQQ